MRKWLNLYFDLSKREYNGLLVLVGLIVVMTALPYIYGTFKGKEDPDEIDQRLVEQLINEMRVEPGLPGKKKWPDNRKKHDPVLFRFDPNTTDLAGWQELGLSPKQSAAILKYIAKGGTFKKKEDLKKMYTISSRMYDKLAPYVRIAGIVEPRQTFDRKLSSNRPPYHKAKLKVVEVNSADSASLCGIKGIGPSFAIRILKFRERVGGFYNKNQLMEVYGLDSVKFKEICEQVEVDAAAIRKISINTAQFEDLKNHPYLRYKQINALIQYRKQHGNYSNIADLNKVLILSPETIARIAPYLVF